MVNVIVLVVGSRLWRSRSIAATLRGRLLCEVDFLGTASLTESWENRLSMHGQAAARVLKSWVKRQLLASTYT